ncbi:MAG: SulP family inorganic anion transporter [Acetobacteraceae bacterium]|nr:SulP family inorganic anion transporter [Pseudomonadota bacterium]
MREILKRDIPASVVVFLVAMPLCMGIAIASGVPPERGLLTGIIGGIVVGLISGAPLQVSGPAAGLVVMVYDIVQTHGITALGPILVLAGAIQGVAGLLRLGQWFRAISPAVVHGMLAGIGVLIVAGQIHVLMDNKPLASGLDNLMAAGPALFGLLPLDGSGGEAALLIGLTTIGAMLAWERWRPEPIKLLPGALVGVVAGSVVAAIAGLPVAYVAVPERLADAIALPEAGFLGQLVRPDFLLMALALAVVASAETLLSASAIDRMQSRVRTRYDRELVAQGVGNSLSGLLGGLPMTGVIVRSSANVHAGAVSRTSTILHGVLILAFVGLLPGVLALVPTAALAGVLVVTGLRLVSLRHVRALGRDFGLMPVAIWLTTCTVVVATDLLTGVLAGLALSVLESLPLLRRPGFRIRQTEAGSTTELRLVGTGTFLRLPWLLSALESVPEDREVRIRTKGLRRADHTFVNALREAANRKPAGGQRVLVT